MLSFIQKIKCQLLLSSQEGCDVLWWVCQFVCVLHSVRSQNSKTTWPNSTNFLWLWLGPPLTVLWLCTSGFTDDITFSYHGTYGQNQARRYVWKSSPGGSTSWTPDNYSVWLWHWGKFSYLWLPLLSCLTCRFYKIWFSLGPQTTLGRLQCLQRAQTPCNIVIWGREYPSSLICPPQKIMATNLKWWMDWAGFQHRIIFSLSYYTLRRNLLILFFWKLIGLGLGGTVSLSNWQYSNSCMHCATRDINIIHVQGNLNWNKSSPK